MTKKTGDPEIFHKITHAENMRFDSFNISQSKEIAEYSIKKVILKIVFSFSIGINK